MALLAVTLLGAISVPFAKQLGMSHTSSRKLRIVSFLIVLYLISSLFNRVTFFLGFDIAFFELLGIILVILVLMNLVAGKRSSLLELTLPRHLGWVYAFFAYAFIGLLIGAASAPIGDLTHPSFNNNPAIRPLIQGATLLSFMAASTLVYRLATTRTVTEPSWILLKAVYAGITLLLVIALLQFVFWATGHPNWFIVPTAAARAAPQIGDDITGLIRLSSWAGEPRTLANNLLLLLPFWLYPNRRFFRRLIPMHRVVVIWGALAFILTFSVSALMALGLLIASSMTLIQGRLQLVLRLSAVVLVAALLGTMILRTFGSGTEPLQFFGRASVAIRGITETNPYALKPISILGQDIYMDFNEQPVLGMLMDRPEFLLFGVGWGNTTFYVRPYLDEYLGPGSSIRMQQVLRPNMAILRYVADVGLVGMAILAWGIFHLLLRAMRLMKVLPGESKFLMSLILVVAVSFVIQPGSYSPFVMLLLIAAHIDNRLKTTVSAPDNVPDAGKYVMA